MTRLWDNGWQDISAAKLTEKIASSVYDGFSPFDPRSITLLAATSKAVLQDAVLKPFPQFTALGYWLRNASLERMRQDYLASMKPGTFPVPRGVALHLPPTNVDTIFAYSWALSVLSGNTNIVRLPAEMSPATQRLADILTTVIRDQQQTDRHYFCHYDYGGAIEKEIAELCDLRLIWGGDAKVKTVSAVPIRPDGLSIGFSDRKSLAIIRSARYQMLNSDERDDLANKAYNDIFWFNQLGCGSPRMIVWIGYNDGQSDDFYLRLQQVARHKGSTPDAGIAISKFSHANDLVGRGSATTGRAYGNELFVVETDDAEDFGNGSPGGGFLTHVIVNDITEVARFVDRKVQTLTYFGLSVDEISNLAAEISGRGGYRIVPFGTALQFEPIWDGIPLFTHFTRLISTS